MLTFFSQMPGRCVRTELFAAECFESETSYGRSTSPPPLRLFFPCVQVEYATKAVENSGTAVGVRCKDGVLLAVEKLLVSKMLVPGSNRSVFSRLGDQSPLRPLVISLSSPGRWCRIYLVDNTSIFLPFPAPLGPYPLSSPLLTPTQYVRRALGLTFPHTSSLS